MHGWNSLRVNSALKVWPQFCDFCGLDKDAGRNYGIEDASNVRFAIRDTQVS